MKQAILLMVDTQRTDMVSCYKNAFLHTPNIDSLADGGMRFDNAFTCQPVCGPARSALFTGLYPHSNGMVANCMQLMSNVKNAGEWLEPHGIECAYIGKWHLDGGDYFGYGKCPRGYNPEYWYDMRNFLDELPDDNARRLSRSNMSSRADDPDEKDTFAHRCVDRAIDFVERFKENDFFLTVSLDEPHDPSVCPRRFFKLRRKARLYFKKPPNVSDKLNNKPESHRVWAKVFKGIPFYAMKMGNKGMFACNGFCDYEFGRLLDKVKELGIRPMIIYTSDHGDMFMSHGLMGKGCVMYNEIVNVPLIIKGGDIGEGNTATPVSHIDILPTVMRYFDCNIPRMLQGQPLQDVNQASSAKRDVFIEFTRYEVDHDGFMGYQPVRCIFDGRYKLVINLLTTDELYDLSADKYEVNNLIDDDNYSDIRNGLHDRLLEQMNITRDVYRGYYWKCRPWRKGVAPDYRNDGMTRQLEEEDFVQLDYSTGLPMKGATRKK